MVKMIAVGLIGVGLSIIIGYMAYPFFIFAPLPIRLAAVAVVVGGIILLVAVGWDRFRATRKENFKEVEK